MIVFALGVFSLWVLWGVLCKYYRLRHVPGPFASKFTSFVVTLKLRQGSENILDLAYRMHEQYGPVVQWASNNVLFSDPSAIPIIYGTHSVWKKAKSYDPAVPLINGKLQHSLLTTRNEVRLSAIKRHINAAFTARAIGAYESHINETTGLLIKRGQENDGVIDLVQLMKLFAFETICRIAFSDVDLTEEDIEAILAGARDRFDHWLSWFVIPDIETLIYKSTFARGTRGTSLLGQQAVQRVSQRGSESDQQRPDLLQHFFESSVKAPDIIDRSTIVGLVMSVINAGAETTSSTMTEVCYLLMRNRQCLKTLREELRSSQLQLLPSYESVKNLPYLDAVIKEAMRLSPVVLSPSEREVPQSGAHIAGIWIPGGTAVAINVAALRLSEDIWGPEPERFWPERWTESEPARKSVMERTFPGFGYGKRMCIGQHIAWIEMKKVIATLVLNFDLFLLHPEAHLDHSCSIVSLPTELWTTVKPYQE